jgi:hypothetical protein
MEQIEEQNKLSKLVGVAKELQRGHLAEENEKQLLKKALKDLVDEDVENLTQLRPKLLWSIVKILSEMDEDRVKDMGKEEEQEEEEEEKDKGPKKKEGSLQLAKTKRKREVPEPCAACELVRDGCDTMRVEVEKVLELYKNQQPIETRNHKWIEGVVRQGADLADFSSSVRVDNLPQKLNQKTEEIDKVLREIGEGIMDVFAASSVAAATFLQGEPPAEKLTAVVILSGKAVWDIESKRRENLYGRAGAAAIKGRRTLTDVTFDANTAYKNTNLSYSAFNNTNTGTRLSFGPQFKKKNFRYTEDEGSANAVFNKPLGGFAGRSNGFGNAGGAFGSSNGGSNAWGGGLGGAFGGGRSLSAGGGAGGIFRGGRGGKGSF